MAISGSSSYDVTSDMSSQSSQAQYTKECNVLDWNVSLTSKHIKEMERCNKFSKVNAKVHYDFLAKNYEGIYDTAGYPDPKHVSKMVTQHTKGANQN